MEQRGKPAGKESKSLQSALIKGCYFDKWDKNKKHKRLQQEAWNRRWALSLLSEDVFAMVSHAWLLEAIFFDLLLPFILLAVSVVWNVLSRAMLCACNAFKGLTAAFCIISQVFYVKRVTNASVVCVFDVRSGLKEHKNRVQEAQFSTYWPMFLGPHLYLQGIISDIWLSTLYHISEPLGWPTGWPKQFPMAPWSMVIGEANLWNVTCLAQSLCSTGLQHANLAPFATEEELNMP